MQTVSALYTSIISGGGWYEVRLDINGVTYGQRSDIISLRTSHALYDGIVSVGNTVAGTIDVGIIVPSSEVPIMAELRPYVRAVNETQQSEWIPKGVFFIDTREYDKETGVLYLSGMDAMLKGEQDYMTSGAQGTWPAVDINVLCDIADRLELGDDQFTAVSSPTGNPKNQGWYYKSGNNYYLTTNTSVVSGTTYYKRSNTGIDSRTLPLINKHYKVQYPGYGEDAYTVREVLGYVGAFYAGNWVINDSGQLRLLVLGDIPAETYYLITEDGDRITLGGDRLVMA